MTTQHHLQSFCSELLDKFDDLLKWQWEERNQTLLAEFSVDKKNQVWLVLQQHYTSCWDAKAFKKAPNEIKHQAGNFARLSKDQHLFSTNVSPYDRTMVVWWPWGHGATISIRIFFINDTPIKPAKGLKALLERLF